VARRLVDELSIDEIAEVFGMKPETIEDYFKRPTRVASNSGGSK
jgi:hypothetical protein